MRRVDGDDGVVGFAEERAVDEDEAEGGAEVSHETAHLSFEDRGGDAAAVEAEEAWE